MPGLIDTHRHMWQTALRGYGGDWALSQYFVFYYLQHGEVFRPEDIYAGNLLSALESVDTGVTTTLDWSHALRTPEYARCRAPGVREIPGRFVLGYGNYLGAPWEWTADPEFRASWSRTSRARPTCSACSSPSTFPTPRTSPSRRRFEAARDNGLRVTTHAGVWGATTDIGISQMYDAGFMTDQITYVHAARLNAESYQKIAATGGTVSVATESEQSAGQGYPSSWEIRKYGIPASLSMDTSVWWSADFFSAMRATLSADRSRDHLEAHAARRHRRRQPAARRGRALDGHHGRREVARHGGHDRLDHAGQEGRPAAHQERPVAGDDADPQPVRPRRVPGGHRRRAHRRRQRPGREVRRQRIGLDIGAGPGHGGRIGRVRAGASSASRPGKRACTRRSSPTRRSRTRTSTRRTDAGARRPADRVVSAPDTARSPIGSRRDRGGRPTANPRGLRPSTSPDDH